MNKLTKDNCLQHGLASDQSPAELYNANFINNANQKLSKLTATQRILFSLQYLPGNYALSSSFGAQSAVSLHLLTQACPDIPIILIDTGYLFPETYHFIDQLRDRLKLNLKIYRSEMSNICQEAKFGQRWTQSDADLKAYNQMNKVEPMDRALEELNIGTWFAGIRGDQSQSRANLPFIQQFKNRIKVHPLLDWSNQQLHHYLTKHSLPYHPLWEKGYVSIGDTHSTIPITAGISPEQTRFKGRVRECGLHLEAV